MLPNSSRCSAMQNSFGNIQYVVYRKNNGKKLNNHFWLFEALGFRGKGVFDKNVKKELKSSFIN